ncbi:MAG: MGDG synthase family glycosyltransferase [Intrasporangium sp.]|uniref:MGDG synthase family glycosyltransferase n=1 Tax=Intrasporangium sp. TaxID=1925024 RepID=UPI003F80FB61
MTARPGYGGPQRLLVLSADMGGGHESTAAALEEAAAGVWPGVEIQRLDTLDLMGPGVGRLFRRIYVGNVEHTPWLYEFFYAQLWRHAWFARASKRFTGSWCGRRLVDAIDRFDPDVIVSTYPLGSSGLAWLHQHRGLERPTGAYVSDIAPHPFWIHRPLGVNFVVHEAALSLARACDPHARLDVCALPVRSDFRPGPRSAARRSLGLDPDALVVLVSCGAYAFGDVARTVRALLDASDRVQVVAACGRNDETRARLTALPMPEQRLRTIGWTEEMPALVRAADLVLSNAGGAIALEAIASGRPLVMFRPIAAHGEANADLLVVSGLAELCTDEDQLTAYVQAAVRDRGGLREVGERAIEVSRRRTTADSLRQVARSSPAWAGRRRWPVRASDAFFVHADLPMRIQEVGAILELEPEAGSRITLEDAQRTVGPRVHGLPILRRRLLGKGRLGWDLSGTADVDAHITAMEAHRGMDAALDDFWSETLPPDGFPWEVRILQSPAEGRSVFAVKTHHVLGDGISLLGLLDRLLDPAADDPLHERHPAPASRGSGRELSAVRNGVRQGRLVTEGLASLSARSVGRWAHIDSPQTTRRLIATAPVEEARIRALVAATGCRAHEVVIAVVAHALSHVLTGVGLVDGTLPLRAMVPVARRAPRIDRVFGNWTAAVTVDLPLGPMRFGQRLHEVSTQLRQRAGRGEPQAAYVAMQLLGHLPGGVRTVAARTIYTSRFFSTIVSYMPAGRGDRWFAGAKVSSVCPVVPLAEGVPVTAGAVLYSGVIGFGIVLDDALRASGLDRAATSRAVLRAVQEAELEVLG